MQMHKVVFYKGVVMVSWLSRESNEWKVEGEGVKNTSVQVATLNLAHGTFSSKPY